MTTTEVKERYGDELKHIKELLGLNQRELDIYIMAYADGNNCTLEAIKYK